jgi:tight adherence protein B
VTTVLLALVGAYGVHLLYTALAQGWRGVGPGPTRRPVDADGAFVAAVSRPVAWRARLGERMTQAGLDQVRPAEFAGVMAGLFLVTTAVVYAVFGAVVPALVAGGLAGWFPVGAARSRRDRRRAEAREAWPRMIEEIRLLTGSVGRSIPQALFDVGKRAPEELRPAFAAAHREWELSTDFERTQAVLQARRADATADVVAETLLVAHEVGGSDVDRALEALAADRIQDLQARKDARAKQAGARFARRFVLLVPLGMAVAGLGIGDGRAAYRTPTGQLAVVVGIGLVAACWWWASRTMRLPEEARVLGGTAVR